MTSESILDMGKVEVGMGCTALYWSDRTPFEVVQKIGSKTLLIRAMDSIKDPNFKPNIIPGGFAGHCTNNYEQKYTYKSNPANRTTKIRLSLGKSRPRGWYDRTGLKYFMGDAYCFHDYNF